MQLDFEGADFRVLVVEVGAVLHSGKSRLRLLSIGIFNATGLVRAISETG